MSTPAVVGGCILGYLVIGLCWARSQAVRLQEWLSRLKNERDVGARYEPGWARYEPGWGWDLEVHLVGHTITWPLMLMGNLFIFAIDWAAKPVHKRREQVGGLRARADEMAAMVEALPSDEERRILEAVIAEDRQLAKELEI